MIRASTLATLILLLLDPELPGASFAGTGAVPWVLLDASVSMTTPASDGRTAWDRAAEWFRSSAPADARILRFGTGEPEDSPDPFSRPADQAFSRLMPALRKAIEAGAAQITVVTDMRIEDGGEVARRIQSLALPASFQDVGGVTVNAGIVDFRAPATLASDDSLLVEAVIFAEGTSDSLEVRISDESGVQAVQRISPPPPGRQEVVRARLRPPGRSGFLQYTAEVRLAGDVFAPDDSRQALVEVDPEAGGLVLVSFAVDWEPRFLLPVLEQVTGLRPSGFLRLGDGRFLSLERGPGGGRIVESDEVRARAEGAELLVVQGEAGASEPWLVRAALATSRLVLFAARSDVLGDFGLSGSAARTGEWYASSDPTPSTLAGSLAHVSWSSLPPLTSLMPLTGTGAVDVPLRARLQGSGPAEAVMVLGAEGGKRRAIVLSSGFWRWAFRPGPARDAYRSLWSSVGGWLLANEPIASGVGVRPLMRVWSTEAEITWRATGREGARLSLELTRGDSTVRSSEVSVHGGAFSIPSPGPGRYGYRVVDEGTDETVGAGELLVESHQGDLAISRMDEPSGPTAPQVGEGEAAALRGRPLRTHPLPYLLVMTLLSAEWIVRRRRGLR